jgi:ATP-binding cassette, subfamily B, bacterial PglK
MSPETTTMRRIAALLNPSQRRDLLLLFGFMLLGVLLEMISVGLVVPALALLSDPNAVAKFPFLSPFLDLFGAASHDRIVIGGLAVLVGVYVLKNFYLGFLAWRETRFIYGVNVGLSRRLFGMYLSKPYTFHLQRNSAELVNRISVEAERFTSSGLTASLTLITEVVVLAGLAVVMLIVEPVGFIAIAGLISVMAWAFLRVLRVRTHHWALARQYHDEKTMQHLQQGLGAAKDVLLLGRESDFLGQYGWHKSQRAHAGQREAVVQQFPRLFLEVIGVVALASLVAVMLAQGRSGAELIPTLGLFAAVAFRTLPAVIRIITSLQSIRFAAPAVDLVHSELISYSPQSQRSLEKSERFHQTVALQNVSYSYPGAPRPALRGASLIIRHGESIGIMGPSGAGKSTLIDVLLGLLPPQDGVVLVDSIDIQRDLRSWQDEIGYVPQSIYLTDDTIRRNIAFGLSHDAIDEDAVWRAIREAQLEQFVRSLPEGLDTIVGERGVRISGGERQRIGIARALYHDPSVLILDEATSSLDAGIERDVVETVSHLKNQKTIVIVSHRKSTVEHCDRLYLVEGGRVRESPYTMSRYA